MIHKKWLVMIWNNIRVNYHFKYTTMFSIITLLALLKYCINSSVVHQTHGVCFCVRLVGHVEAHGSVSGCVPDSVLQWGDRWGRWELPAAAEQHRQGSTPFTPHHDAQISMGNQATLHCLPLCQPFSMASGVFGEPESSHTTNFYKK